MSRAPILTGPDSMISLTGISFAPEGARHKRRWKIAWAAVFLCSVLNAQLPAPPPNLVGAYNPGIWSKGRTTLVQQVEADSGIPNTQQPKVWLLYLSKDDTKVLYLPVPPHQTFRLCMPAEFSNPNAPLHVELGGNAIGFRPFKVTGDPNCAWISYAENGASTPLTLSVDHADGWPHERLMIVSDQNAIRSRSRLIRGFAGWRSNETAMQRGGAQAQSLSEYQSDRGGQSSSQPLPSTPTNDHGIILALIFVVIIAALVGISYSLRTSPPMPPEQEKPTMETPDVDKANTPDEIRAREKSDYSQKIITRYTDAYLAARATVTFGTFVKVVGFVPTLAILLLVWVIGAALSYSAPWAKGALVFVALVIWLPFWIVGVVISAQGQFVKAGIDSCVNTSPFLTDEERAQVMSLI